MTGRLLTGTTADPTRDRLPPGQRLVGDWPVLDLGAEPNVTGEKFGSTSMARGASGQL